MNERWRNPDGSVNNYREYIHSQEWRRRRRAYLRKYPLCNRCGMDNEVHRELFGTYLHVHHVNYSRLGAELDEDLETLCKHCHNAEETAEFDPTEYGDPLAIDLGVGIEQGRPVLTGIGFGVIDYASPPEEYWLDALVRIEVRRHAIAGGKHTETAWDELRSEERRVGKECRSRWWPYH